MGSIIIFIALVISMIFLYGAVTFVDSKKVFIVLTTVIQSDILIILYIYI